MPDTSTAPDLRFPIGRAERRSSLTPDQRRAAIDALAVAPEALRAAVRGLTDAQLDAVRDSGGVVGVNFAVTFLREDGMNKVEETGLDDIMRHVDYLADRMGIDHVAFGSDFDGAAVPAALGGVSGLPRLVAGLGERHDAGELDKITHENWLRVLDATWR